MNIDIQNEQTLDKQVYTVEEVASILNLPLRTAYRFCSTTDNFKVKKIGRLIRVDKQSFTIWLKN